MQETKQKEKVNSASGNLKKQSSGKFRYIYMEILRIMACYFVVFNHTDGGPQYAYVEFGSFSYWLYLFMTIFSRIPVPLFFMISGALLLGKKEESLKNLWIHRIGRVFVDLLVFSGIYYLGDVMNGVEELNPARFFSVFFRQGWLTPFWFLYAYIGFLVIVPFLRKLVQNLDCRLFWYFIVLYGIFDVAVPMLEVAIPDFSMNYYFSFLGLSELVIFYPCAGYFFHHMVDLSGKKKWLIPLWIADVAVIAISCYWTYRYSITEGVYTPVESFYGYSAAINSITLMLTAKTCVKQEKMPAWLNRLLETLGACTFGVYLMHPLLLERIRILTQIKYFFASHSSWMNVMVYDILFALWITCLGFALTWILKKIPGIRKFL